nr:[Lys7]dermorphin-OH=opioid peptide [Phyllomedusa bicolor=frogs, skin, Peptide, 7 aa] [Phyllomedusa bicolor]
YAFGYPK